MRLSNFRTARLINLSTQILMLFACILLKSAYTELTSLIDLPELFEHMLYRVILAFLFVETIKGIVFLFYRPSDPSRSKDNFTIGINHISTVLYGLFGITLVLAFLNISIKEAITTLSLIAAAVVLMTKDYISNLINGMYLTFAKVITIGDQVMIEGHKGKIVDITLTNVHLLNEDDDMIYLPNNLVFSREIINYTRRELKKTSIEFEADPFYIRDIEALENELIKALLPFQHEIQTGTYALKTTSVKRDLLLLKFQYILKDPLNKETDKKIRKYLIREIVKLTAPPGS
jgi:small-conductance mechanosensitive channel